MEIPLDVLVEEKLLQTSILQGIITFDLPEGSCSYAVKDKGLFPFSTKIIEGLIGREGYFFSD